MRKREEHTEESEEAQFARMRLPKKKELEMFAVVKQMLGSDKVRGKCEDGIERVCRITGKMRKRVWIKENDLIIVRLWDFQPIKADIVWRYMPNQTTQLKRRGLISKSLEAEEMNAK